MNGWRIQVCVTLKVVCRDGNGSPGFEHQVGCEEL